jgi:hypothetical protein
MRLGEVGLKGSILWWIRNIGIAAFALFFLLFGIETLIGAFQLKNPFEFIMYFFSASLIILISLVGVLYPLLRVHALFKSRNHDHESD